MIRTKRYYRNAGLSDNYDGQLLSTVYALSQLIPELRWMKEEYYETYYTEGYTTSGGGIPDHIREEVIDNIHVWLDEMKEDDRTFNLLKVKMKNFSCFYALLRLVDTPYKKFFLFVESIPAIMVRPFIWTSVASRRAGAIITSKGLLVGETDSMKVLVKGIIPYGRDLQTIHALVSLMNKVSRLEYNEPCISFRTSYLQLCTEMQSRNPSEPSVQQAVIDSLERLRGCVLTWLNKKDGRTIRISGILSEVESDEPGEITIHLHTAFLRLYEGGHVPIDEQTLYRLQSDRAIHAYCYLRKQKDYMSDGGRWSGWSRDGMHVSEFYRLARLGDVKKPKSKKRDAVKDALEKLISEHEVRKYRINKDDKLIVWRRVPDPLSD